MCPIQQLLLVLKANAIVFASCIRLHVHTWEKFMLHGHFMQFRLTTGSITYILYFKHQQLNRQGHVESQSQSSRRRAQRSARKALVASNLVAEGKMILI
jgi:hypothetical protein